MVQTTVGKLEVFLPKLHNFPKYVQCVQLYFKANNITEDCKKAVFLSALGYEMYDILTNIFTNPETEDFDMLVDKLTNHFHPKSSIVAERYKFGCCRQGNSESLADFFVDLQRLSARCNLKADALDENLRDRFVCDLTQEYIRSRLLTKTDKLSFDRAVEIAISLEGAKLNAQLMKSQIASHGTREVHRVGNRSSKHQNHSVVSCYRCGGPHLANKCRFIKENCHSCGKTGHISKVCRSKPSVIPYLTQARSKGRSPKAANVVEETSTSSLDDLHQGFRVYSIPSRVVPLRVTVTAYGHKLDMELDTGSALSIISEDTFKSLFQDEVKLKPTTISLR